MLRRSDTWLLDQLAEEFQQKVRLAREVTRGGPDSERIPSDHQEQIFNAFARLAVHVSDIGKRNGPAPHDSQR
jgi:hypothetical protein